MTLVRKEHIVPRWLLSEFAASDGVLWVYAKDKQPRRSKAENECCERDFFEFALRGRRTNNSYENWLSQIEGGGARLLDIIKQRRKIVDQDAKVWAIFVASLFGRTRKVRAQVSEGMTQKLRDLSENPELIRDWQYELLQQGVLYSAEDLKQSIDRMRKEMDASQSYYHVSGLPVRVQIIAESLLTRHWHTIGAPEGASFLISDCPVVTYEVRDGRPFPGSGFGNENTVAMLPVSPKRLWVASPHHLNWRLEATISGVNNINRLIVQFAHRNLYANVDSKEISDFVNEEIDTVVFGENAFVPQTRTGSNI